MGENEKSESNISITHIRETKGIGGAESFESHLIQEMDSILKTDGLFFKALQGHLRNAEPGDVITYLSRKVAEDEQVMVDKLSYYLRMFLSIPAVQNLINHKDFPDQILESLLFESYLNCFYLRNQDLNRFVKAWTFLSQERLLQLLLTSGHVSSDLGVSLSLLVMLDNKGLDEFLKCRNQSEEFLLNIVSSIPPEKIGRILASYPLFCSYIYLILKTYDKKKASAILRTYRKHLRDLETMEKIMKVVGKIPRSQAIRRFSEERVLVIRELLEETSHPETIMNLLEVRNVFESDLEVQIVKGYVSGELLRAKA